MKNYASNQISKRIALVLAILMVFSFAMPKFSYATEYDDGGKMFAPITSFLRMVSDLLIQGVQKIFTGDGDISTEETVIEGETDEVYNQRLNDFIASAIQTQNFADFVSLDFYGSTGALVSMGGDDIAAANHFGKNAIDLYEMTDDEWQDFINPEDEAEKQQRQKQLEQLFVIRSGTQSSETIIQEKNYSIKFGPGIIFSGTIPAFDINFINPMEIENEETDEIITEENSEEAEAILPSSAAILRSVISRWYQDLQMIALVGLLSVLVYIAIRMILSSTGQDKARYKKMLADWLVAMCIIFILHYIMVFVLNIVGSITEMVNASAIGANNEDILMSKIRNEIGDEKNYIQVFANIIMYMALVIFTITFSIQYLKRVLNMAFLTIIAPLIALTYPLDKIKDGQAQAFTMWIREYIFNALIQPVHLLLYVLLVGTAVKISDAYPIYGVVAIGFLVPAEKFFRKMFGFEKASSVGTLSSIAGGAAVMSMVNKIKGPKGKSGSGAGGDGSSKLNRTGGDPLEGLRSRNTVASTIAGVDGNNSADAGVSDDASVVANNSARQAASEALEEKISQKMEKIEKKQEEKQKRDIKGIAKQFSKNIPRKVLRFTGRAAGTLALGSVGLAAGVTTGDLSKAFAYGVGAGAVGGTVGKNLGDAAYDLPDSIRTAKNNLVDTWNEGAYGKEYAQNVRFDREFMASEDGKKLVSSYSEGQIQQCLSAGITDAKQIKKILEKGGGSEESLKQAIGYSYLAEKCPDSVLYGNDVEAMRTFLTSRNVNVGDDRDVEAIQEKMRRMKL